MSSRIPKQYVGFRDDDTSNKNPITIELHFDFLCPFSKKAYLMLRNEVRESEIRNQKKKKKKKSNNDKTGHPRLEERKQGSESLLHQFNPALASAGILLVLGCVDHIQEGGQGNVLEFLRLPVSKDGRLLRLDGGEQIEEYVIPNLGLSRSSSILKKEREKKKKKKKKN